MRRLLILILALSLVAAGLCFAEADREVNITISPDTLVLEDGQQEYLVTVHAEIAYSLVDTASVTLNGISAELTKPDSRGELVAKFIIGGLTEGRLDLILKGQLKDGDTFSGSDDIWVIDKEDGGPGSERGKNQKGNREGAQD
jgi:hypothetical protein